MGVLFLESRKYRSLVNMNYVFKIMVDRNKSDVQCQ